MHDLFMRLHLLEQPNFEGLRQQDLRALRRAEVEPHKQLLPDVSFMNLPRCRIQM